jgi:hypothetical protein
LDGFVSLDAEDRGEVVTKPFMLQGEDLYVNAEVKGELRAEVLDGESLRPLSGLSDSDCEPLQGDHLHGRINWQEPRRQGSARPVRLRFVMRDAKLYAFWLEK